MWNEVIYSPDEIIKKYGRFLEKCLGEHILEDRDQQIRCITMILSSLGVEYDWRHSSEGFENWLSRMTEEEIIPQPISDTLSKLWSDADKVDCEWKSVYYGLIRAKRKGVDHEN